MTERRVRFDTMSEEVKIDDDGNYLVTFEDGTTESMSRAEYEQYLEQLRVREETEAEQRRKDQEVAALVSTLDYVSTSVLPTSERDDFIRSTTAKTPSGIRRARKQLEDKECLNWICDTLLEAGNYPTTMEDDPDGIAAFLVDNRIETVKEIISMMKDEFKDDYGYNICMRNY